MGSGRLNDIFDSEHQNTEGKGGLRGESEEGKVDGENERKRKRAKGSSRE